jgi:hypothetical protein
MWSGNNSAAATAAEVAAEAALGQIFAAREIHCASPAASGRIAMAVYHEVMNAGGEPGQAEYFADWWANDGGDLDPVPDGTAPEQ